ncbi:uncharacterized protein [Rutidosis leptorrhynchoides]|uniref:uncharacterized protein n=1 Tax=Rutidosis leptorrhynchoides TaxID=125765 RepID=UPI003A99409F
MKVATWNVRGLDEFSKQSECKHLIVSQNIKACGILETRIQEQNVDQVWRGLHLNGWQVVHNTVVARLGRVWLVFDDSVDVQVVDIQPQWIHARIKFKDHEFMWTIVYAHNEMEDRRSLWEFIAREGAAISIPWFVQGDFNVVLKEEEKKGGHGLDYMAALEFEDALISANLLEMRFQDPLFTWNNRQEEGDRIYCKLDRVLLNQACSESFRHHKPKTFRFYNMWMLHSNFGDLLTEAWNIPVSGNPIHYLWEKLKRVKQKLKVLNKNEFSDISKRVATVRTLLSEVQVKLMEDPTNGVLQDKEKAVNFYLQDLLARDSVKKRQTKNAITRLVDNNGVVLTDHETIGRAMVAFYTALLGTRMEDRTPIVMDIVHTSNLISAEDGEDLCREMVDEEI